MARQSSAEKAEFWKMAIAEHAASGLSVRKFCRQQSLSEPSFYAWKRKLKQAVFDGQSSITFAPVRIASPDQPQHQNTPRQADVQIRLPSGVVVEIFAETSP